MMRFGLFIVWLLHFLPLPLLALAGQGLGMLLFWFGRERRRVARMIMRRARVVLVNDDRTADEIRDVAGVESRKVSYLAAAGPW